LPFHSRSGTCDSTPLSQDEAEALVPTHVTTQQELNEWEQANILRAEKWAFNQRKKAVLEEGFVRRLHRRMFDETWSWAGSYRSSDKNLGVPWYTIREAVGDACDTARYWVENNTFSWDEIAVRLHHRLVAIHPFPNGNGRHARLFADTFLHGRSQVRFTWGNAGLTADDDARKEYISALRIADKGDFAPLLAFARS
jgi:Fic-DOC domain mobile mystery protein B